MNKLKFISGPNDLVIYKKDPDAASEMAEAASDNNDHTGAILLHEHAAYVHREAGNAERAEEHQARAEEHRKLETAGGCDLMDPLVPAA
jgi:hypothetical protein